MPSRRRLADARASRRLLLAAERQVDTAVLAAIDEWLTALRFAILRDLGGTAVTAAAYPHAPFVLDQAAQASWNTWRRALDRQVLPSVAIVFGEAFQQARRRDPLNSYRYQQQYLEDVADRLRIWPQGAFEDIRPELMEALAEAESIDDIRDRIGRVLNIDAKTRAIRAVIHEVEQRLDDPDLPANARQVLSARRRELWEAHDDSLGEWQWKARRIARTEAHGAVLAGKLASAKARQNLDPDVKLYKRWLATDDTRTRATHRVADGQVVPLGGKFRIGGFLLDHPADAITIAPHEVINCFVADTAVRAPGLEASIRTPYVGPLVTLTMKSGGVLTGSPNHPVLTERGWVRLGDLHQGHNLIRAAGSELDGSTGCGPNKQGVPATLGEIHGALDQTGLPYRVPDAVVNFHGDRPSGEVDVIAADRELRDRLDAAHREHLTELGLEWRGPFLSPLPSAGSLLKLGFGPSDATDGGVGSGDQFGALGGCRVAHASEHGVAAVSRGDATLDQGAADDGAADATLAGDRVLRFASEVAAHSRLGVEHGAAVLRSLFSITQRSARSSEPIDDRGDTDAECSADVRGGLSGEVSADDALGVQADLRASSHLAGGSQLDSGADERDAHQVDGGSVLSGERGDGGVDVVGVLPGGSGDVEVGGSPRRGGSAVATQSDASLLESVADGLPSYAELLTDMGRALAGLVELDEVVGVDVSAFRGHLFTVQTVSGIYSASSYIVRNCRCDILVYDDDELQDELQGPDGSIGQIRPGGVRIGPDDPDDADRAIAAVAADEQRVLPRLGRRGEDHGQAAPAGPERVELTDAREKLPPPDRKAVGHAGTDLTRLSDDQLLDEMQRANDTDDDALWEAADAEWERRYAEPAAELPPPDDPPPPPDDWPTEPSDDDGEDWESRQDALGIETHGEKLEPHEVVFVERFAALGHRPEWIPRDTVHTPRLPTNDFRWLDHGGIEVEVKGTSAKYSNIKRRIRDAVRAAESAGVVKENFIVDLGEKLLTPKLRHQLELYNVRNRDHPIARLWVMSRGILVAISLQSPET